MGPMTKEEFSKLTYRQKFAITEYGYLLSPENAEVVGKMLGNFHEKDVLPFCQANGKQVSFEEAIVEEAINEPQSHVNWLLIKMGSGAISSLIVTTIAAGYFERGCTNSNYMGNLFFIFIVSWIAWVGISSLVRGNSASSNLAGMLLSLLVILLGVSPCISLIGFWIAPVCN